MSDDAVALAAAVRRVMNVAVLTEANDVAAATAEINALADRLAAPGTRDAMPWPDPESMRRGHRPYSPVIGEANPIAPPMRVRQCEDGSVMGEATMRPIHEGPPGAVHGGWVASLLDQLLGHANAAAGVGGFTAQLTVKYLRPTPYDVPLVLRARTDRVEGRTVMSSGQIVADGVVTAEANGVFKMPSPHRVAALQESLQGRSG